MITSLSEDMHSRKSHLNDYEIVCKKLDNFIEKVNDKIVNRIQLVKQVYLDDYKQQVSLMAAQLKSIRAVLDQEQLKQRSNQRLFHLQEERDFFRAQVIKLNEDLRKSKDENSKIKAELSQSQHQCSNFRKIAYELETKIYKLTYQNLQMDKIKGESSGKNQETTNPSLFQFGAPKQAITSHKQLGQSLNASNSFRGKQREKTQYSLRKLKPSRSLVSMTPVPSPQKFENEPSKREQILDNCIKEVKKQIFYRNVPSKQSSKIHFDEMKKINFNSFTKSDKKQLVYRLMSDSNILQDFYQFIFDKKKQKGYIESNTKGFEKLVLAKGVDAKFNTKMLLNYKTEFDKKIYDIKANRI